MLRRLESILRILINDVDYIKEDAKDIDASKKSEYQREAINEERDLYNETKKHIEDTLNHFELLETFCNDLLK